jgi:hypothetical protein
MTALTLALSIWGASLSTVLGAVTLVDRRRLRRRQVSLRALVVHRRLGDGTDERRLHLEATNLSEQAISLAQWFIEDDSGRLLAGSPYEGRVNGPDLLQPLQMHGWTIEPHQLQAVGRPVQVTVVLTSGERITAEVTGWNLG